MNPRWAAIWVLTIYSARALFLPSLEEDRTARPLQIRQEPNESCNNLTAPLSQECYQALQISEYLISWPLTNLCNIGELWSTCFIRLSTGRTDVDCITLGSPSCNPLDFDLVVDPAIKVGVRYVIATIQNVHSFFSKMANVTKSVNEQDPVLVKLRKNPLNLTTNAEVDQGNYITALTMGLPYLAYQPQEANIRHIGNRTISDGVYGLAFAFAQEAILRAPILIGVMWPADGSTLSDTDDVFAAGLTNLLTVIQRFVAFTQDGSFASTMDIAANLSDPTGLSLAASTLFTTTGLLQNGFIVVPDPKKVNDPTLLIPAGRKPEGCTRIADGGNEFGRICESLDGSPSGARYWSAVTNRTYNFQANITSTAGKETLASGKTNAKQALLDIWNEGYADINVMFDGGYQCQSQLNFGALLRVSTDGRMDFNCFSSLPMDLRGVSRTPTVTSS